ncbi:MAG TPA: SMC-Scp complex subunit ScpB [Candidatus Omnitrophota bacterium]|nr:SMC-Scp complex subunit ScpB [Candidatus Omnitrophota bacterium]HRZ15070.1 SMC-Scp complex subunit ScpB [Candidatus Omnitrophota bacterium]
MESDNLKAVIEALLFASEKPLLIEQIRRVLDNLEADKIRAVLEELKADYERYNRGIRIYEVAGGFQMIACPHFATFLKKLFRGPQHSDKMSRSALETLAIIAYKQPLSKLDIESLRKVNVDGVMHTLLERNVIRVVGRKKAPGRPKVYGTSRQFLEYFGLKSLEELPKIENFPVPAGAEISTQDALIEKIEEPAETQEEHHVTGETTQTS